MEESPKVETTQEKIARLEGERDQLEQRITAIIKELQELRQERDIEIQDKLDEKDD